MDKKLPPKEILSSNFEKNFLSNDYENLFVRLKSIKQNITLLEKICK